jgi:tRNA(fMet)-specific endonuclease VapC
LGAYRSANVQKKLLEIRNFLPNCIVLKTDNTTAETYGIIKTALLNKGKPIPVNDIWIGQQPCNTNCHFIPTTGILMK